MYNNELYHYGVPGMRWGVRRRQKTADRNKRRAESENWSSEARAASETKRKSLKQMSNDEIRALNERTRLEREYKSLNPNAVKKGWGYVIGAAAVMGTVCTLYDNSNKLVKAGKKVASAFIKK